MITKEELKKCLPHGSYTKIALKAKVTKNSVTKFFNDQTKTSPKIFKAALECAIEYQNGTKDLVQELENTSK